MKKPKKKVTPLMRAINNKKVSIVRTRALMATIREAAEERCAKLQKNIDRQQFMIEGLQAGRLKP